MQIEAICISLLVAVLWGASTALHKYVLGSLSSSTVIVVSGFFYTICLLGFCYYHRFVIIEDLHNRMSSYMLMCLITSSIVCGFLANILYFYVLRHNPSSIVAALSFSAPLFVAVLGYVFLKERLPLTSIIGIVMIVVGIMLLSIRTTSQSSHL